MIISVLSRFLLHFVVVPIIIIIWIISCQGFIPGFTYEVSKKITQNNIIKLKPNMHKEEIIRILGQPFSRSTSSFYSSEYQLNYSKLNLLNTGVIVKLGIANERLVRLLITVNDNDIYACDKKKCYIINQCNLDKFIRVE
jgi:hypothetical protein